VQRTSHNELSLLPTNINARPSPARIPLSGKRSPSHLTSSTSSKVAGEPLPLCKCNRPSRGQMPVAGGNGLAQRVAVETRHWVVPAVVSWEGGHSIDASAESALVAGWMLRIPRESLACFLRRRIGGRGGGWDDWGTAED
jgi:hypothetical protein